MFRCTAHRDQPPPAPAASFRLNPQPYVCKGCAQQLGTEAEQETHYCPCCGERLQGCIRNGSSTCPTCGPISRSGEFVTPVDYLAELLAGRQPHTVEERAAALLQSYLGQQVGHYVRWTYRDGDQMHATLARGTHRIALRVDGDRGQVEAASPCQADRCRGKLWTTVTTRADLLRIYQHGPGRTATCDRCGTRN
ncbi:hypothetical protein ACGF07_32080 [Kitasatospora sp. NPDC048194]|uniref:hypothetical protein n=1 Tax=Kitasatospora sp. NPDC048194 TaxID=3364045 RepID=UPI003710CD40